MEEHSAFVLAKLNFCKRACSVDSDVLCIKKVRDIRTIPS